ncbi:MAG: hypothetical protein ACOZQL_37370 [Myxococcota bacterium]
MTDGQRILGFVAAVVALGLVVGALVTSIFGASGPEGAIVTRLKRLERDGVELPVPGGALVGSGVHFQRISVQLDADGRGALVTSTLDFTGHLQRGGATPPTKVSSLGLERARFVERDGEWVPESTELPRLTAILRALEARRRALEAGEAQADGGVAWPAVTKRALFSEAWFIRSERELVEIAEDFHLVGTSAERPVDERATRRLSVKEETDGGFSFPEGIL